MLLSDQYYSYVSSIISLVGSLVIKSPQTITALNNYLTLGGDVLSVYPAQWKYYRNLAGLPYIGTNHSGVTPSKMSDPQDIQIYSLDTNELIPFTPTSLVNNPVTRLDLITKATTYNNLLLKYPNYRLLIDGVLNPIDINTAIEADPYTILNYDSTLLGSKETNLISGLQSYINNYYSRWDTAGFILTDNLYSTTMFAILILALVNEVIVIRLKNCKTPQAHEYHVWNYLGGYYNIDQHKNIIPFDQALWLYRNIDHVTAHAGTNDTLDFLNTNFAIPYGIQLYDYTIRKDIGNAYVNLNAGNLTDLSNDISITKYPHGITDLSSITVSTISPSDLVNKLMNSGLLNPDNITKDINNLVTLSRQTTSNEIPTRVIEVDVTKNLSAYLVNIFSERLHNWFYLTANNFIKYKLIVNLPDANISNVNMSSNDAAALMMYATLTYFDQPNVDIPTPRVRDIMVYPTQGGIVNGIPLTKTEIESVIESKYLTGIIGYTNPPTRWNRYDDVINSQTFPREIISLKDFNNFITSVVNNKIQHTLLPYFTSDAIGQSEIQFLIKLFYQNQVCKVVPETTFPDFFTRLNIDVTPWNPSVLLEIINYISTNFLNVVPVTNTLQSPYSNMLSILSSICSYTLTWIPGPATNNVEPIDLLSPCFQLISVEVVRGIDIISSGFDSYNYIPLINGNVHFITIDRHIDITIDKPTALIANINSGPGFINIPSTIIYSNWTNFGSTFFLISP